jgi:hypothetical protein
MKTANLSIKIIKKINIKNYFYKLFEDNMIQ